MIRSQVEIIAQVGLHARPATILVENASKYKCNIHARNVTRNSEWMNVKSILGILQLGAEYGHSVELMFDGLDEIEASHCIESLISRDFTN